MSFCRLVFRPPQLRFFATSISIEPAFKHHWRKRSGRWNTDEVERLKQAVQELGDRDWVLIGRHVRTRNNVQCFQKYRRCVDPRISRSDWTQEEDEKLRGAVRQLGRHKWTAVAQSLSTGRTDIQCKSRWESLQGPRKHELWTAGDTRLLREAIQRQDGPEIDWLAVSETLKTRTPHQCREKYKALQMQPYLTIGPWSTAEDLMLLRLIKKYGESNWSTINERFPQRAPSQCRQRWLLLQQRFLVQSEKQRPVRVEWTPELDTRLLRLVEQHGRRWSKISLRMSIPSDDAGRDTGILFQPLQCERRFQRLMADKNAGLQRGIWSDEETGRLRELREKHGNQWRLIADQLKTRTAKQCATKFRLLSQAEHPLKKDRWTREECEKLEELVRFEGHRWTHIAQILNRGPRHCATKFSRLMKESA